MSHNAFHGANAPLGCASSPINLYRIQFWIKLTESSWCVEAQTPRQSDMHCPPSPLQEFTQSGKPQFNATPKIVRVNAKQQILPTPINRYRPSKRWVCQHCDLREY